MSKYINAVAVSPVLDGDVLELPRQQTTLLLQLLDNGRLRGQHVL